MRCEGQPLLYKSFKKYGFENHVIDIIHECSQDEADTKEAFYIQEYKSCVYDNKRCGLNVHRQSVSMGYIVPQDIRDKISTKLMGHSVSQKTRDGISKANLNRTLSDEHKEKMYTHTRVPILQLSKEGLFIRRWDSMGEVTRTLGIHTSAISNCCRGLQKQSGGYKWTYENAKVAINGPR